MQHKYLLYSPSSAMSTVFISGAKINKTSVQLDINFMFIRLLRNKILRTGSPGGPGGPGLPCGPGGPF